MKISVVELVLLLSVIVFLCTDFSDAQSRKRVKQRRRRPGRFHRPAKRGKAKGSRYRKRPLFDVQQVEETHTGFQGSLDAQYRLDGVTLPGRSYSGQITYSSRDLARGRSLDDLLNQLLGGNGGVGSVPTMASVSKPKPLVQPHSGQWIRMRGKGSFLNAGVVEVYRAGQWGVICDDSWDLKDAKVACRQLGFRSGAVSVEKGDEAVPSALWGQRPILMDEMQCTGSESRVQECTYSSQHDCTLDEAATVTCKMEKGCPGGWFRGNDKCYKLFSGAKGIKMANAICSRQNASLLNIDTSEENHFISDVLKKSTKDAHYWYTGGRLTKNVWKWFKLVRRKQPKRRKNRNKKPRKQRPPFKTTRATIAKDRWFPGWPSDTEANNPEPVKKRKHNCLVLSDEFNHPERGNVVLDYFFWKAVPCRQRGGIHFICQIELKPEEPEEVVDCVNGKGFDYRGEAAVTKAGTPCVQWSESNNINERTHPGKGLGDHRFCRNPDEDKGPWCWTDHTRRTFGFCDIPQCSKLTTPNPADTTTAPEDLNCPVTEFYCSQQRTCVPAAFRCDNEYDCTYGEDEENCEYKIKSFTKTENSELMPRNPQSVYTAAVYLGMSDERCAEKCLTTSDFVCRSFLYDSLNRSCQLSSYNSRQGSLTPSMEYDYFEITSQLNCDGQFVCDNGFCIDESKLCDGQDDCKDLSDEAACDVEGEDEVEVGLVGDEEHAGTVTVTYKGSTGLICDDEWDIQDAHVVCRMLGYRGATQSSAMNAFEYPPGKDGFMLDNVECVGTEESLADCPKQKWKQHDCKAYEIAGVTCQVSKVCEVDQFKCDNGVCLEAAEVCDGNDSCGDGSDEKSCQFVEFLLVNGSSRYEGRVEVKRNGLQGTVCDDTWDDNDAAVVCAMMGYRYGGEALREAAFGSGQGPVWLDNVNCTGQEDSLVSCNHSGWGKHDCDHSEDAGVRCYRRPPTTKRPTTVTSTTTTTTTTTRRPTTTLRTTTPEVSIVVSIEGGSGSHEGTVVISVDGRKYHICDDYWEDSDASVVCRSLGYSSGGIATEASFFGSDNTAMLLDNVQCLGTEKDLIDCRAIVGTDKHDCDVTVEKAGVICNKLTGTTASPVQPQTSPRVDTQGTCGQRPYDYLDLLAQRRRRRSPVSGDSGRHGKPLSEDTRLFTPRELKDPQLLKVVGGRFATHGAYPWQVRVHKVHSILRHGAIYGSHHCGAVIISEYWMLSAAHCFYQKRKSEFRMVVGDHHQSQPDKGEQMFAVEELLLHPQYSDESKDSDIALIKVRPVNGRGIKFNNYVQPACLPTANRVYREGTRCYISGWGNTRASGNSYPQTLKAAEVPLISQSRCQYLYDPRRTGAYTDRMMCAGYVEGGIDTCDGDSGGPLVCNIDGLYTLLGLTSWGRGCAQPGAPGVYANVAKFLPWISDTIQAHSQTSGEKALPGRPS